MGNTIRAFIALKLPVSIIDYAAQIQSAIKARGLQLRWVKPSSLHLTLKFLGNIRKEDVHSVGLSLKSATQEAVSFVLTMQGLGIFPSIKKPKVFWIGLGGQTDELHNLHSKIEDKLQTIGFVKDKRGFKAHLTLARFKAHVNVERVYKIIEELGCFTPQPFSADHLVFYKSDIKSEGAVHTPLAEFWLTGG